MELTRRALLEALVVAPFIPKTVEPNLDGWVVYEHTIIYDDRVDLYGIPYHQTDASTGQWLGFERK